MELREGGSQRREASRDPAGVSGERQVGKARSGDRCEPQPDSVDSDSGVGTIDVPASNPTTRRSRATLSSPSSPAAMPVALTYATARSSLSTRWTIFDAPIAATQT
ncbi:MAG: hypothetical protein IPM11_08100 [Micropruina sp.]|nr:hypothetical protein [Micropruina sp.]